MRGIKEIVAEESPDGKCYLTNKHITRIYKEVIKIPIDLLKREAESKEEAYGTTYTVVDVFNDIVIEWAVARNQDIYYTNKCRENDN